MDFHNFLLSCSTIHHLGPCRIKANLITKRWRSDLNFVSWFSLRSTSPRRHPDEGARATSLNHWPVWKWDLPHQLWSRWWRSAKYSWRSQEWTVSCWEEFCHRSQKFLIWSQVSQKLLWIYYLDKKKTHHEYAQNQNHVISKNLQPDFARCDAPMHEVAAGRKLCARDSTAESSSLNNTNSDQWWFFCLVVVDVFVQGSMSVLLCPYPCTLSLSYPDFTHFSGLYELVVHETRGCCVPPQNNSLGRYITPLVKPNMVWARPDIGDINRGSTVILKKARCRQYDGLFWTWLYDLWSTTTLINSYTAFLHKAAPRGQRSTKTLSTAKIKNTEAMQKTKQHEQWLYKECEWRQLVWRKLQRELSIPKTIGNRKRDCAWGCARGINTPWENLQIEKQKSGRCSFRSLNWFVLFDLQIFSGGVYARAPPHAQSRFLFPIVFGVNSFFRWEE